MNRVLVVSPHPDDEAIGCGGTLCMHAEARDETRVIFLTSGERGGHGRTQDETAGLREKEAEAAAAILGVASLEFWRLPDGNIRADDRSVDRLGQVVLQWKPGLIYVTHADEMHADHRAAARIVRKVLARREISVENVVVRQYEIWTPLSKMDDIVDISEYVERSAQPFSAPNSMRGHAVL